MLKWRINELIAEHRTMTGNKMGYREIAEGTGLGLATVAKLVSGKSARVELATLDALLNYFNAVLCRAVSPGDLFLYEYDGKYDQVVPLPGGAGRCVRLHTRPEDGETIP